MEYTVQKLAKLAGVTTRTLRYYDNIGLLCPVRQSSSGYRIYGIEEVDRLQQILFFRELDFPLEEIASFLADPAFDPADALRRHRQGLLARRDRLDKLIATVDKTIAAKERRLNMSDKEKFESFKEKLINDNEEAYGDEIREKYGSDTVEASNAKLRGMSEETYNHTIALNEEILALLDAAFADGADPAGQDAQKAAALHKEWIGYYWPQYTAEAHMGLAEMYVADERFAAHYNRGTPGKVELFRDALKIYLNV